MGGGGESVETHRLEQEPHPKDNSISFHATHLPLEKVRLPSKLDVVSETHLLHSEVFLCFEVQNQELIDEMLEMRLTVWSHEQLKIVDSGPSIAITIDKYKLPNYCASLLGFSIPRSHSVGQRQQRTQQMARGKNIARV